ncbi:hypothetical protein EIP91_011610 [Steccherinum ochraceum]|uniref:Uncharacterized protein n=1 Tax=Steccherinum ochraceum TaxID=92696 RepID=A0A4R0RPJ6_9APHY|nr:hypothetical protein EIP91_011610 [Steccherinum ochraceum]
MHPAVSTTLGLISLIVLYGTVSSVINETYLDTSNPLLTHLPHPLHHTHYFASKSNFLNVYFIKQTWGWVSLSFLFLYFTSPPVVQTWKRLLQFLAETAVWMVFTSWFFGAPVLERVIANTGGECVLNLPDGGILNVPYDLCYTRTTVSPLTHPSLFAASLSQPNSAWTAKPRLRRGHDVSGHIFLLTMATLFLADQLRHSFKRISTPSANGHSAEVAWSPLHFWAVLLNAALIGVSLFSIYTTCVYFHTPFEKFTGYVLGVASFGITQTPLFA